MHDVIVIVWVGFIFVSAVFFASSSMLYLIQSKKIKFDQGFLLSLSAFVIAITLSLSIWPPVHRVYDDEFTYISQSTNIIISGKANITLKGSRLKSELFASWTANTKLPGFSFLEAVILFLTKDFNYGYFILNIILGALAVAVVYRIAWLLTSSQLVSWWSAIFLACLPARITYSMSAASDIAGLFLFLLFFLFIYEYRDTKLKRLLYAALFSGAYCICIKQFYGIFIVSGLFAALYIYRRDGLLVGKALNQVSLDATCIFLPILIAIPLMFASDTKVGAFSFSFMLKNVYISICYLFNGQESLPLMALSGLVAVLASIFYKKDNLVNGFALWFMMGLLMISVFCGGGISYPGFAYSDRYILSIALPFTFIAGKGMEEITSRCRSPFWGGLFLLVLLINAIFASNDLTVKAKNNFYYQEISLLKQAIQLLPNDAYILNECAALVVTISPKKAIQTEIFLNGDHPRKVIIFEGIPDDFYNPEDFKKINLLNSILKAEYSCKPLTASPLKEGGLSATPMLCVKN